MFPCVLTPGESYKIKIHFSSDHSGLYEQLLVFKFKTGNGPSEKFEVMRLLEVTRQTSQSENSHAKSKEEQSVQTVKSKIHSG